MTLAPGTRLGPYEVLSAVGAGGMGEVYKARDTRLSRTVAIKVLPAGLAADPDRRRRFEQEARTATCASSARWASKWASTSRTTSPRSSQSAKFPRKFW